MSPKAQTSTAGTHPPALRSRAAIQKKFKGNAPLMLMALPGIIAFFVLAYLPMFGVIIAFKNYKFADGILGSEWIGLKNFEFLFASDNAWRITYNTLFLNALFIFTGLVAAIGLALLMNEVKNKWANKYLQSTFFFPHILSWVVVAAFAVPFLALGGMVNDFLDMLGIKGVNWYTKPEAWPWLLTVINIWKGAGYSSIVYLAAMLGISHEYYESAKIDGANKLQQIFYITLPLLKPLIIIMTVLAIGRIFYSDFGMFYNLIGDAGQLYSTTDVIDTYVFRALRQSGDVGMASAAGLYQSVVGFTLVLLTNYAVRKLDKDSALF